ncbi:MAG: 50S ribosomal protein L30 [Clostridia bacterium]|nr:50S ribosomal protein L30 [Clostridia bacterium]
MAKKENGKIKVTLIKSTIAILPEHKKVVAALGLRKINSFKIHNDTPAINGMIDKVKYLVKVEKI